MAQRIRWSKLLQPLLSLWLCKFFATHAFVNIHDDPSTAPSQDQHEQDFFPPLIDSDDISYFFSTYDLDGLHWALTNIFQRSSRHPTTTTKRKPLPDILVARGGGEAYTSEYKLRHDLEQARYLVQVLTEEHDATLVEYLKSHVIPIYEQVLTRIPPLSELGPTKGLYAFTRDDYDAGIATVYNKALYFTSADELHPGWREESVGLLNSRLDWEAVQRKWFGEKNTEKKVDSSSSMAMSSDGVIVIDNLLNQQALDIIRKLLLRNTHWYQTKTPLQFGKYVGAYIDDGLHDPIFLELAKALHQTLPRIMKGHDLRYMWAYKYDSEWSSGINLHADQAAVNVNIWLSLGANLDEKSGGLVVFTAKPPESWDFESYNTNTDMVVEELLRPTNFANITVPHRPNRAVIFDSTLFHQTDKYTFKQGYENGRINLTFLFGKMSKGTENDVAHSEEL
ncbi:hypothetical protein HJC23_014087 [Cyclotella cryptica]|uniref:Fe2OG dioxygenase domain-containing protein n=1 Tax=Cyclotella cryptica TaxID=29204 RepID=A0ABD3QTJ3_9STRA|eukprot:CCRYP_002489-RA/>CCRYP_002489-RA protein AED:0.07 eAED:0.07 QI:213/1/1/1/1/1/4/77/450